MIKDAQLQVGDVIIQNAANSSIGQSIIQFAHAWGYKTVNIVRNRPDIDDLKKSLYEIGADVVVTEDDIRKPIYLKKIKELGKATLGLNGVGGKSSTNLARLLTDNATFITYGGMSREPVVLPTALFIFRGIKCSGFWFNLWSKHNTVEDHNDMMSEIFNLSRQGKFRESSHIKVPFDSTDKTILDAITSEAGKTIFTFKS
jgi:trans-2-enoyl-CoA reductase